MPKNTHSICWFLTISFFAWLQSVESNQINIHSFRVDQFDEIPDIEITFDENVRQVGYEDKWNIDYELFIEDKPNLHIRWIILSDVHTTHLFGSSPGDRVNRDAMKDFIIQARANEPDKYLDFKLMSCKIIDQSINRKVVVERILYNFRPLNDKLSSEFIATCGLGRYEIAYRDLSSPYESAIIPTFKIDGLWEKALKRFSKRIPSILIHGFGRSGIDVIPKEVLINEPGKNLLAIIVPQRIVKKILEPKNADRRLQLSQFVEHVRIFQGDFEVKLLGCAKFDNNNTGIEWKISRLLITLNRSDEQRAASAYVTVYGFGDYETNQYGYPTFTDERFAPFTTYKNPELTKFFHAIDINDAEYNPSILYCLVPIPMENCRLLPWNHDIESQRNNMSVHIHNLRHEIREKSQGDFIPISGKFLYLPNDRDSKYQYAGRIEDLDMGQHYLFIMITMDIFRKIIAIPRNPNIQIPKRRQLFNFVESLKMVSSRLEVKLWTWGYLNNRVPVKDRVSRFLQIHKPLDGREPVYFITIYGFDKLNEDFYNESGVKFEKYENEELDNFFATIGNENACIDLNKATCVPWPHKNNQTDHIYVWGDGTVAENHIETE